MSQNDDVILDGAEFKWKKGVFVYKENPFWNPQEIAVGKKHINVAGGMHISENEEQVQHSGIHIVRKVDKEEFVKVYTKNIRAIFELKPSELKVVQFLMSAIQKTPGADGVYLNWFTAEQYFKAEDLKMSRSAYFKAMTTLLQKKFLAESNEPNMYWFNPHLFFNGDRMTFINEYRLKQEKTEKPVDIDDMAFVKN